MKNIPGHTKRPLPTDREGLTHAELDFKITQCLDLISLRFPRIVERLDLVLGTLEFELEMTKLIVDDRGTRTGFPPHVLAELLTLSNLHTKRYGSFQREAAPVKQDNLDLRAIDYYGFNEK